VTGIFLTMHYKRMLIWRLVLWNTSCWCAMGMADSFTCTLPVLPCFYRGLPAHVPWHIYWSYRNPRSWSGCRRCHIPGADGWGVFVIYCHGDRCLMGAQVIVNLSQQFHLSARMFLSGCVVIIWCLMRTLNRFFAFHVIAAFVLAGLVVRTWWHCTSWF